MPEPVSGFDIETADEYSITLIWNAPKHEIDYFEITVSEDDNGRKISTSKLPAGKTKLVIQDLESAVNSCYKTTYVIFLSIKQFETFKYKYRVI